MADPAVAELRALVGDTPLIDTHEHIGDRGLGNEENTLWDLDTLMASPYISQRLISAGVDSAVFSNRADDPERFRRAVVENLDLVRATCQHHSMARAFADLYGFDEEELTLDTWDALDQRVRSAYAGGYRKWCAEVFRRANIELALKNTHMPYYTTFVPGLAVEDRDLEQRLFRSLPAFDWVLFGYEREKERTNLLVPTEQALGMHAETFDEYLALVAQFVAAVKRHGAVGLKCTAAYFRSLDFDISTEQSAHRAYNRKSDDLSPAEAKAFQDFLMQYVVRLAAEHELPIHVHTGEIFGTEMDLAGLAPSRLCPLLSWPEARRTTFVLLHGGYPYIGEITAIAKTFPNVFVDVADVGMTAMSVFRSALHEWLEAVPSNKILMGGDGLNIEHCYGVMVRQREALAEVLAEKLAWGHVSLRLAKLLAYRILRGNAREVFRLDVAT
jgi:predicted TIM-barrel fold metal-dependent hydrolase